MKRRVWQGIDSIEEGDQIRWENSAGVSHTEIVYKIVSRETLSPSYGLCLEFYSDRVKREARPDFFTFQRVVPEEWITHWRKKRVRSSGHPNGEVDSSNHLGAQIELPIQEGGQ